jgi:hypothetical protein
MYEPRIADKITVDLRCDDCPDGARCARCQSIVDAAVADTLAAGIAPEHVNVAPAGRECARCGQPAIPCAHSYGVAWDHAVKADSGPCAGLLSTYDVR